MKKILGSFGALFFAAAIAACGSSSKKDTTPVQPTMTADAGMGTGMEGSAPSTPTGNPCSSGGTGTGTTGNPCSSPK